MAALSLEESVLEESVRGYIGVALSLLLVVAACGQAATPTPTPTPPTATSAPPTALPATEPPTAVPPIAAPTATNTPAPTGSAFFRDRVAYNDAVAVVMSNVAPPPPGSAYQGWLVGADGEFILNVGPIPVNDNGEVQVIFAPEPAAQNLLERYDAFLITIEADQETPAAPSDRVAFSGRLPLGALVHIRHVLLSFPDAPEKTGLGLGLRSQADELLRHAQFQQAALDNRDLDGVKRHAEHMINLIEGQQGANFGDLNNDRKVQNPGDGYGLLENGAQKGYVAGAQQHAVLGARATDATDDIQRQAEFVRIAADNVLGWVQELDHKQLALIQAKDLAAADPLVRESLKLADQIVHGVDANANEQIEPAPGEGGAFTAYQYAQLMAGIPLQPGGAAPLAVAQATVPPPTATPAPPAVAPGEVKVEIVNFLFGAPLTVKAGTTVVWANLDKAPHTVTADNGEFDSGVMNQGDTFSFTFNQPGDFPYFCELHGNRGGVGMAGTVTVEP